jgi:hypothetical protein
MRSKMGPYSQLLVQLKEMRDGESTVRAARGVDAASEFSTAAQPFIFSFSDLHGVGGGSKARSGSLCLRQEARLVKPTRAIKEQTLQDLEEQARRSPCCLSQRGNLER